MKDGPFLNSSFDIYSAMKPGIKGVPQLLDVTRQPGRPKKRKKITLVFDEEKRKDFLGGFHKRKLQRRRKAQDELKVKLKEEKKRIKQEARERFKTLVSQRDVPELEELLQKTEYEADGKTVSILELNVNDLSQSCNWIGENRPKYEEESEEEEEEGHQGEKVPGMELNPRKSKDLKEKEKSNHQLSKKSISKARQKETLKQANRSKVFQLKQRLDRQKNKKLAKKAQFKQERAMKKAKGKTKRKLMKKM
ncbi:nucleolar protein 12 [Fopius arisanus]|uniref:Nucleolar protein 12 n=1 Tax=Fopius arisanus TaxID=64838 RepID=A0A0C9RLZ7_9HYME|nr:PREDICTED: nucleolar protein 12 [Fopius arisanus]